MASTIKTINDLSPLIIGEMFRSYNEMVSQRENWKGLFTREITSNQMTFTRTWIYDVLRMTEQPKGKTPEYKEMSGTTAEFTLSEWSEAVRMSIYDKIEATNTQDVFNIASNMGSVALSWYFDRILNILINGDSTAYVMYDGENYFGNSHDRNGNAYDNLLAGTFDLAGLTAARTAMARFPSDQGEPMELEGTDIFLPHELDMTARTILRSSTTAETNKFNDNPLLQIPFRHHSLARLSTDDINDWYLIHTGDSPVDKPFIDGKHSEFGDFRVIAELDQTGEAFRVYKEYRWSGFMTRQMLPSHPYFGIKFVNA